MRLIVEAVFDHVFRRIKRHGWIIKEASAEATQVVPPVLCKHFPVDLLVRTPAQIAARLALGDGFFHDVLSTGVVLHEATHARVGSES